jgi:thioredoxin reductase (NADPH)
MVSADELKRISVFKGVEEEFLGRFARKAADVHLAAGEWLMREGETPSFYVLLEGRLQMVKDVLGRPVELPDYTLRAGDFFGEVPILMGSQALVSIRADTPCRLARFDKQHFQYLIRNSAEASGVIMQKMNERLAKKQLYDARVPAFRVTILGAQYDTDCRDVRVFLSANRIPYEWVDRERDPERVPACVPKDVLGPAVVVDAEHCIHPPSVRDVARALQLQTEPKGDSYDVVIAGAGPAGMAAGVYGASEGLKVLMVERFAAGGQAGTSSRIENYFGFPEAVSGEDLTARGLRHATRFGAEIAMTRSIEALRPAPGGYCLELDGGGRISARTVLLATGVDWRRLEVDGADRLQGRGVLYGASRTEAIGVNGKRIFIVGGGNSAGQAAVFFSNYAAEVKILVRGAGLKQSMSQYLIGQLATKDNVEVLPFTEVMRAEGEEHLERIVTRNLQGRDDATQSTRAADALFVMIGADAITDWLPAELERDDKGYIRTGRDLSSWGLGREAFPLETNLPGVFCAGDVRHGSIKRVSSGVGEGSMAIAFIHQYLALQENAGVALSA